MWRRRQRAKECVYKPGLDGCHQKLEEKCKVGSSSASRRNQSCQHLGFGFPGTRTVKEYMSVLLSHRDCGKLFCSKLKEYIQRSEHILPT